MAPSFVALGAVGSCLESPLQSGSLLGEDYASKLQQMLQSQGLSVSLADVAAGWELQELSALVDCEFSFSDGSASDGTAFQVDTSAAASHQTSGMSQSQQLFSFFGKATSEEVATPRGEHGEVLTSTALDALYSHVGFALPDPLLELLGYFYIKCLLHPPFKRVFTRCFVRNYGLMIDAMLPSFATPGGDPPPVSKFLDLLSCQLFHDADHVGQLVDNDGLLFRLMSKLDSFATTASDTREFIEVAEMALPWAEPLLQGSSASDWTGDDRMAEDHGAGEGESIDAAWDRRSVASDDVESEPMLEEGDVTVKSTGDTGRVLNCLEPRKVHEQLFMRLCADTRSIINHESVAIRLVKTPNLLRLITRVLARLHYANTHVRQSIRHVEYESRGWQYAFILEFEMAGVLKPVIHSFGEAGAPENLACAVVLRCASLLLEWRSSTDAGCVVAGSDMHDLSKTSEEYKVSHDMVSFHLTLHRCMTAFVFERAYRGHTASTSLEELWCLDRLPPSFFQFLIDHPIRVQVLCAQIEAHRWVRNGTFTMNHQVALYRNRLWHEMGMDLDFFLMQCGAQLLGSTFILMALHRFELAAFFSPERLHSESNTGAFDGADMGLAADFLLLIISLGRDRTRVGMPKDVALRREIVCWLGVKDMSFSQLLDRLHPRFVSNTDQLEPVLAAVAEFHEPQDDDEAGIYRLKENMWPEVDPLFLRLNKADRASLEERMESKPAPKCRDHLDLELLWPTFSKLPAAVFQSGVLHRIVFTVILRAARCCQEEEAHDELFALQPVLGLSIQALLHAVQGAGVAIESETPAAATQSALLDGTSLQQLDLTANSILSNLLAPLNILCEPDGPSNMLYVLCRLAATTIDGLETEAIQRLRDECAKRSEACAAVVGEFVADDETEAEMETSNDDDVKKEAAKRRQAAILEQFARQQQAFMSDNFGSSDESEDDASSAMDNEPADQAAESDEVVAECVLCQQQGSGTMVMLVTMQKSCVASHIRPSIHRREHAALSSTSAPKTEELGAMATEICCGDEGGADGVSGGVAQPDRHMQICVQSCGHTVHHECLKSYQAAVATQDDRGTLLHYAGGEFACPVCRQLCNSALPLFGAWGPSCPANEADADALIEFLHAVQRRRPSLSGDPASTAEMVQTMVNDCTALTEIAARDSEDGSWFDNGQGLFFTNLLRSMGRLRSLVAARVNAAGLEISLLDKLHSQFVGHFMGDDGPFMSFDSMRELCLKFFAAGMLQNTMAILPALSDSLLVEIRALPWICCLCERIDFQAWIEKGSSSSRFFAKQIVDMPQFISTLAEGMSVLVRRMALLAHLRFGGQHDTRQTLPTFDAALSALSLPPIESYFRLGAVDAGLVESSSDKLVAAAQASSENWNRVVAATYGCGVPDVWSGASILLRACEPCNAFTLIDLPEVYVNLLLEHQETTCTAVRSTHFNYASLRSQLVP
jgi:hypothetical protein